jgi:hypothetical protein
MHLIEKYSLNCGINPSKLDKGEIFSSYYPLPFDKYIVFHASSGMPAKNYSYYQDVIDFIYEAATKNGYGFVQIGGAEDKNLNRCLNLNGKTNIFQTSFILKNAALLVANDSFSTHVCSSYGTPSISLYSVIQPQVAGPYWNNGKQLTLMAPLNENKPTYSREDPERIVDNIKPEDIINNIQKLLPDIASKDLILPETLFIGRGYRSQSVDIVPDSNLKPNIPDNFPVNLRFDLLKNEAKDENFLSATVASENKKFFITISSNIDVFKIINQKNQQNLLYILININEKNYSNKNELKKLCEEIKRNGAPLRIIYESRHLSEKQISDLKFDFLDVAPLIENKPNKKQEEMFLEALKAANDLTLFKSSHILFSSGEIFLSEESYRQNKPSSLSYQKIKTLKNSIALSEECDNIYLYNT